MTAFIDGAYGIYNKTGEAFTALGNGVKAGLGFAGNKTLLGVGGVTWGLKKGAEGLAATPAVIPAAIGAWRLKDEMEYAKYRSMLANRAGIDYDNKAELMFANSMDRLIPSDGSGLHRGHWQDLGNFLDSSEKTDFIASSYVSAFKTALNGITWPRKIITVPATMMAEKMGLLDPNFSYGENLDPQAKFASYAAIGLMSGQFLRVMSKTQKEGKTSAAKEMATLRNSMYDKINKLVDNEKIVSKDIIDVFKSNTTDGIANHALGDYQADKPAELGKAQAVLKQYHNENFPIGSKTQLDSLSSFYNDTINSLNQRITNKELNDPRVIHMHLHKLRLDLNKLAQAEGNTLQESSIQASNALFDAARELSKGNTVEPELEPKARELLTALQSAGPLKLANNDLSDTTIEGGLNTVEPVLSINDDSAPKPRQEIPWAELKQKEADRITAQVKAQNDDMANNLKQMVENYHNEVNNSINAASRILRLNEEQAKFAINIQSTAAPGSSGALDNASAVNKLSSVQILARVMNEGFTQTGQTEKIKGIQGPAWDIHFTPADEDDLNSTKGTYTVNLGKQSKVAKQQAIIDQASLISLNSKSISFTATSSNSPRPGQRGQTTYNRRGAIEMALMQAIAVQLTTGLDPKQASFKLHLGYDKNGKEVYTHSMTINQLLAFGSKAAQSPEKQKEINAEITEKARQSVLKGLDLASMSADERKKKEDEAEAKAKVALEAAENDEKEAQRLGIRMSDYFHPKQPGVIFSSSASKFYDQYQKAVEARKINEAGSSFTQQTSLDTPNDPGMPAEASKGTERRLATAEKHVYDQFAQTQMPDYKDKLDAIKAKASQTIDDDATVTGQLVNDEENTVSGGFGPSGSSH